MHVRTHQLWRRSRRLRNGRAAGPDEITPELLQTAEIPISTALYQLLHLIWKSGNFPADWKEAVIISLHKGKGPRTTCSSYRPISLLLVPGKVFAHVLLERLQPILTRQQRPQQPGFTRTRSTIDAILALRLLAELHREFRKPLHVAYIDIKAAFDSVDRQALWKALHVTGAPQFLIQLIQDLHTGVAQHDEVESGGSCQNHSTLLRLCAKGVFLHQHYSVWQLTGSCPDVPAVLALLSVKQCSQTSTMQTKSCSSHKI